MSYSFFNAPKGKRNGLQVAFDGHNFIESKSHLREMTKKEKAKYLAEPLESPFRRTFAKKATHKQSIITAGNK